MDDYKQMRSDQEEQYSKIVKMVKSIEEQNGDKTSLEGFQILATLLGNILKDPKEEKFRLIKKTNPKVKAKLLDLKGPIQDLLVEIGYADVDGEFYAFGGDYLTGLRRASEFVQGRVQELNL